MDKQVDSDDVSLIQNELDDGLIDKLEEGEDEALEFDHLDEDHSKKSDSLVEVQIAQN